MHEDVVAHAEQELLNSEYNLKERLPEDDEELDEDGNVLPKPEGALESAEVTKKRLEIMMRWMWTGQGLFEETKRGGC
jgi:hypothetical protein